MTDILVFADESEAMEFLKNLYGDDCMDSERIGYQDDEPSMSQYQNIKDAGCCGSFDSEAMIGGRKAVIGCNFGH